MRPLQVFALFAGASTAFSFDGVFEDAAVKAVHGLENVERLFRRQNTDENASTTTQRTTGTTARTTASATESSETGTGTRTGSTSRRTGSITAAASASGTDAAASSTTSPIDNRSPAGGASMIIPDRFAGSQFYKVGDWVTFAWNYTNVLATPTAVNVLASCSQNNAQWTIAANMSYQANQTVYWDTNQYKNKQTPQLIQATYTLIIENAEEAKATAISSPGEVGTINTFNFGMYPPDRKSVV